MDTLVVALCAVFIIVTAVKTSNITELHKRTVKPGENVTMECNIRRVKEDFLVWYKRSSGKVPQILVRSYSDTVGYKFVDGFDNNNHFNMDVNEQKFYLIIRNVSEDDKGEYFCGKKYLDTLSFTSGTRLQFEDKVEIRRPTSASTLRGSSSSHENSEICAAKMRTFFWLSVSRIGLLGIIVLILTACHTVLKSRS